MAPVGASPIAYPGYTEPTEMTEDDIAEVVAAFGCGREARHRGRLRPRRTPCRPRLPPPFVPLPAVEPAHRPLRR